MKGNVQQCSDYQWPPLLNKLIHLPLTAFITTEITSSTMKMKKIIFAIPAAEPAIPPNPNTAATIAITKNINAQRNITNRPFN